MAHTQEDNVDVFRRETQEIINLFLSHRLTFPECIASLDQALAHAMLRASRKQIVCLQILISANEEIVRKEMDRRNSLDQVPERFSK